MTEPTPLTEARDALANPFDFSRKDRALRDLIAYTETLEDDLERESARRYAETVCTPLTDEELAILDASAVSEAPAPTEPPRVLLMHPHDGHGPNETCLDCQPESEASDV